MKKAKKRPPIPDAIPFNWTAEELGERASSVWNNPTLTGLEVGQLANIVTLLEMVRRRPAMFVGRVDPERVSAGLTFLQIGLELAGKGVDRTAHNAIATERGWRVGAVVYWEHMKEHGFTPEEIVDEILVIEIEAWRRLWQKAQREAENNE